MTYKMPYEIREALTTAIKNNFASILFFFVCIAIAVFMLFSSQKKNKNDGEEKIHIEEIERVDL